MDDAHILKIEELTAGELAEWSARRGRPAECGYKIVCSCGRWESAPSTSERALWGIGYVHQLAHAS